MIYNSNQNTTQSSRILNSLFETTQHQQQLFFFFLSLFVFVTFVPVFVFWSPGRFLRAISPTVLKRSSIFLPSFALTILRIAPKLVAYYLATPQSTSSSSHRSILLQTTASTMSLGPLACSSSTHFFITSKLRWEVMSYTHRAILAYR